jgi:hypothetical protein
MGFFLSIKFSFSHLLFFFSLSSWKKLNLHLHRKGVFFFQQLTLEEICILHLAYPFQDMFSKSLFVIAAFAALAVNGVPVVSSTVSNTSGTVAPSATLSSASESASASPSVSVASLVPSAGGLFQVINSL